jgi:hypothetical protein
VVGGGGGCGGGGGEIRFAILELLIPSPSSIGKNASVLVLGLAPHIPELRLVGAAPELDEDFPLEYASEIPVAVCGASGK